MRKDEVLRCSMGLVARKACFVLRLVHWLAVYESAESPTARRSVFSRVLDHDLNRRGSPGNESLEAAQGSVVFERGHVFPRQLGKDCAVREGKCRLSVGFRRQRVSENAPQLAEAACFMRRRDQLPVPVSIWNFDAKNRGTLIVWSWG
jgi:hypothetical protein